MEELQFLYLSDNTIYYDIREGLVRKETVYLKKERGKKNKAKLLR